MANMIGLNLMVHQFCFWPSCLISLARVVIGCLVAQQVDLKCYISKLKLSVLGYVMVFSS